MTIIRVDEIRKMKDEERHKELSELRAELSSLMSKTAMGGSLENPARVGLIKKTIARFYTIEREEELGIRQAQQTEKKPKAKKKKEEKKEPSEGAEEPQKKSKEPKKRKAPKKKEAEETEETAPEATSEENPEEEEE